MVVGRCIQRDGRNFPWARLLCMKTIPCAHEKGWQDPGRVVNCPSRWAYSSVSFLLEEGGLARKQV